MAGLKEESKRNPVRKWINQKTEEDGFTALHFASFRGNIQIIQLLIEHQADIYLLNGHGLSMIHVAAQGDQAISLVRAH